MARIVHKSKGLFGETIYTDENFRLIGTSQKGLFGEDVYLDKDFCVQGYGRKGLGNTRVYVDKDGHYAGWGGKGLGSEEVAFMDGARAEESAPRSNVLGGLIFLGIVLGSIALFIWAVVK